MKSIIAVTNKHTAKLHHVGSLYILTYDARKLKHKMQGKDIGTQNMVSVKTKVFSPLSLLFTCHFYYYVPIIKFYALCEKENCLEVDLLFITNSLKSGSKNIADCFVHDCSRESLQ